MESINEHEKEILFSDWKNDSDIYMTKDKDIVSYETGYSFVTKQEKDKIVNEIFSVNLTK